jgi:hypothetical protein
MISLCISVFETTPEIRVTIGQRMSGFSIYPKALSNIGTALCTIYWRLMACSLLLMSLLIHWQHPTKTWPYWLIPPCYIKLSKTVVRDDIYWLSKWSIQPATMGANRSLTDCVLYMNSKIYMTGKSFRASNDYFLQLLGRIATTLNRLCRVCS